KIRQIVPDVKIVAYLDTIRESADDTLQRFSDSLQIGANGKPTTTVWTNVGATNNTYLMVPTLQNSLGKEMLDIARRYMDDMGLDGIYWDEMEGIAFGNILKTYTNNFDGHSCILDPETWRVKQEVGIVPLSSQSFEEKVIDMVHQ